MDGGMMGRKEGFGRIIAKSYLTPSQIKEGRIWPLNEAKKLVKRRQKQGYLVKSEPHDGANVFPKTTFIENKTKVKGEYKRIRVEKRIWDISRKKR